ncbi:hypothetical protein HC928_02190 [bacterium]|nr:hypothetical protein [bacterium]
MSVAFWEGKKSRQIIERIIVEGDLELQTPAHLGSGDDDGATMSLLVDPLEGHPLLTGASIAGALRSYLWNREAGYRQVQRSQGVAAQLFGGAKGDDDGDQSHVIVCDALAQRVGIVYRDGVRLEQATRTASDKALFNVQLWDAGTIFPLRFELVICEGDDPAVLTDALWVALKALESGEIPIGARKRRGYGRVKVKNWRIRQFQMSNLADLMAYLREGGNSLSEQYRREHLPTPVPLMEDNRKYFTVEARFTLDGSLLIRSADSFADMAHLTNTQGQPILSGTSLTGAIRARAYKILNTLQFREAEDLVIDIFGGEQADSRASGKNRKRLVGSRFSAEEHHIEGGVHNLVQNRVSIDRFTGGALDTALFNQRPLLGSQPGGLCIRFKLQNPAEAEIGLLLLVLKDLWTGDLPLGGEQSVGRGRLRGTEAQLSMNVSGQLTRWTLVEHEHGLEVSDPKALEDFVQALSQKAKAQHGH